ncbi:MAG: dihydrodipicolinate reductase [Clostridia bacterium]|nr:dihydrodipicolinate reductase [Clostridia bacterium]
MKVVQYGVGKMSKYTMRYVIEKGWEIVGAFDRNSAKFGKDISCFMETAENYGVEVQSCALFEEFLVENKPDVVIVTTMSLFGDVYESLEICARCGVNAITTCEEAFYPQNSNPTLFNKIDKLAKENNCTITGSGYQDIFWGNLIAALAGATHKITKIVGKSSYNVEDYGIALAKAHGAGLTLSEFDAEVASADRMPADKRQAMIEAGEFMPSYMWNVNGWLADKLGFEIVEQSQECVPHIAKQDLHSDTLEMDIKKGDATGMSAVVTSKTKQGVVIQTECIGKVYDETECDSNEWEIHGEPNTPIVVRLPQTVELTCATIVNRLPDVVKARAGYVPTSEMQLPQYRNNVTELN